MSEDQKIDWAATEASVRSQLKTGTFIESPSQKIERFARRRTDAAWEEYVTARKAEGCNILAGKPEPRVTVRDVMRYLDELAAATVVGAAISGAGAAMRARDGMLSGVSGSEEMLRGLDGPRTLTLGHGAEQERIPLDPPAGAELEEPPHMPSAERMTALFEEWCREGARTAWTGAAFVFTAGYRLGRQHERFENKGWKRAAEVLRGWLDAEKAAHAETKAKLEDEKAAHVATQYELEAKEPE